MNTTKQIPLPERIFELLKRRGPLCQSQLSSELLTGTREIDRALQELEKLGVAEPRPDRSDYLRQAEQPWGLRLVRFGKR
jgi:hypothetical protein